MKSVPEKALVLFQKKYFKAHSKLIPYHLGEEGSDGAIYQFSGRDVLLKICRLGEDNLRQDRLRFDRRLDFLSFLFEGAFPWSNWSLPQQGSDLKWWVWEMSVGRRMQ